nr:formin-like protein 4 [Ipomoea batatas]
MIVDGNAALCAPVEIASDPYTVPTAEQAAGENGSQKVLEGEQSAPPIDQAASKGDAISASFKISRDIFFQFLSFEARVPHLQIAHGSVEFSELCSFQQRFIHFQGMPFNKQPIKKRKRFVRLVRATKHPDFLPLRPASAPAADSNYTGSTVVTAAVSSSAAIVVSAAIVDEEGDQNCNPSYRGRYSQSRRERGSGIAATNPYDDPYPNGSRDVGDRDEFSRFGGKVKGVIVDEEGLDVLYRRKLESGDAKESFRREVFNNGEKVEEKMMIRRGSRMPIHEIPLLRGKSSTSHQ